MLPKRIYTLNSIPITIPARVFIDIDKLLLELIWKGTGTTVAKTIYFFVSRFFVCLFFLRQGLTLSFIHSFIERYNYRSLRSYYHEVRAGKEFLSKAQKAQTFRKINKS